MLTHVEATADEYSIKRYSRGDRDRVFELLRVAKTDGFVGH
jgi:hypothetical protein